MGTPVDGKTLQTGPTKIIPNYTGISSPHLSIMTTDRSANLVNRQTFGSIASVFSSGNPEATIRSSPVIGRGTRIAVDVNNSSLIQHINDQTISSNTGKSRPFSVISATMANRAEKPIHSAPSLLNNSMEGRNNNICTKNTVELDFGDDGGLIVSGSTINNKAPIPSIRITNRVHTSAKGNMVSVPKPKVVELTESGKIKRPGSNVAKLPITINEVGIVGTYRDDLDIKALHVTVTAFMEKYFQNKLIELMEDYSAVNAKLDMPQYVNRKASLATEYHRLRGLISESQIGPRMEQFNVKTSPVLAKYDELGPLTEELDIDEEQDYGSSSHYQKKHNKVKEPEARHSYRHDIIGEYLGIIRSFCPSITITRDQGKQCRGDCGNCGANVHQTAINEGEPTMCPACGTEVLLLISGPRTSDNGPPSRTDHYGNWSTTVYPYYLAIQGRNNSQLTEDDYQKIGKELTNRGYNPNIISRMNPNKDGRRGNVTIAIINQVMTDIGYSKYLNDVYVVARTLFGWNLPDLAEHDIRFEELYRQSQDTITLIKESTDTVGTSSINAAYRVWWLLSVLGIQLDKTFLGVVTTPRILQRYLEIRLQVDKQLNWTDPGINFYPQTIGGGVSTTIRVD